MARAEIISIALGADLFKIEPSYKNLYVMLWRIAKIQDPLILCRLTFTTLHCNPPIMVYYQITFKFDRLICKRYFWPLGYDIVRFGNMIN